MARKPLSQREAYRLKKRVEELEAERRHMRDRWVGDWPASIPIHRLSVDIVTKAVVKTARTLEHAVVVTIQDDQLVFWASKP